MDQNQSQSSFKNKEQRTQKLTARADLDPQKQRGELWYARTMLDLLKDPVSMGLKGGFKGYQR